MKKCRIFLMLAVVAFVFLIANQSIAGISTGKFCIAATSANTGITHFMSLNYTWQLDNNHILLYGDGFYIIDTTSQDRVAVHGSGIFYENKFELVLQAVENQRDYGHDVFTSSNTHIWVEDLEKLTGTWSAESLTFVNEAGAYQQFDKGTVQVINCEPANEAMMTNNKKIADFLQRLDKK